MSPNLYTKLSYDLMRDLAPVTQTATASIMLATHPSVPAKNMRELVGWIKAQSTPVNYGSGGIGSIGHIVGETMKLEHGLKMEHVGYKGSSPMHNDLLSGTKVE